MTVTFNATDSYDPDGDTLTYFWDFGDEVTSDNSSSNKIIQHTYTLEGTFEVKLTVSDNNGVTHSITQSVSVTKPKPEPQPSEEPTTTTPGPTPDSTEEVTPSNTGGDNNDPSNQDISNTDDSPSSEDTPSSDNNNPSEDNTAAEETTVTAITPTDPPALPTETTQETDSATIDDTSSEESGVERILSPDDTETDDGSSASSLDFSMMLILLAFWLGRFRQLSSIRARSN